MMIKQATTVAELFQYEDEIIQAARREQSRMGFFPVVYHCISATMRAYSDQGMFQNIELMDQMALGLFNRYFEALQLYQAGELPSRAWLVAFEAAQRWWPTVGQQVMLCINPHINLDLGIVVARSCPPDQLPAFRGDFFKMNELLSPLIGKMIASFGNVSPLFGVFSGWTQNPVLPCVVDAMGRRAWRVAEQLARLSEAEQAGLVARLDREVEQLGRLILALSPALAPFRLTERGSITEIMDTLSHIGGGVDAGQ